MVLRTHYDRLTGKDQHDPVVHSLFSDVMYREEDSLEPFDLFPEVFNDYHNTEVYKHTGITLDNFLNLPIPIRDKIVTRSRYYQRVDAVILSKQEEVNSGR